MTRRGGYRKGLSIAPGTGADWFSCSAAKLKQKSSGEGQCHILSTGCQWRAIPKDLPPRSTLHDYFDLWSWDGTLDRIHHALYVECRERAGREASPTAAIIDSQSVKSAEKGGLTICTATMRARRSRARSGIFSSTHKAS
jgi:transposase